jgi:hypothetical protein
MSFMINFLTLAGALGLSLVVTIGLGFFVFSIMEHEKRATIVCFFPIFGL